MEAAAFVVKCRAVAPCGKWTVVLMPGSATVGDFRQKRCGGERQPVKQPRRWTAGGQMPLDGASRGNTGQPVAHALIRENVTGRHGKAYATRMLMVL